MCFILGWPTGRYWDVSKQARSQVNVKLISVDVNINDRKVSTD